MIVSKSFFLTKQNAKEENVKIMEMAFLTLFECVLSVSLTI